MGQTLAWSDPSHTLRRHICKTSGKNDRRPLTGHLIWPRGESPMTVLEELATARGRRDEVPNQELARRIVRQRNAADVKELVDNLANKDKAIQSDCIKVLYEIGGANPDLIAKYYQAFSKLLESKSN